MRFIEKDPLQEKKDPNESLFNLYKEKQLKILTLEPTLVVLEKACKQ